MKAIPSPYWLIGSYFSYFFAFGVFMPYWSLWLQFQGVTAYWIGIILGLGIALRLVGSLLVIPVISQSSRLVPTTRWLSVLSLLIFLPFFSEPGLWGILILTLVFNLLFAPLTPICDAMTLNVGQQINLDYGRTRVWGSASFAGASLLVGWSVSGYGETAILWLTLAGLIFFLIQVWLPMDVPPRDPDLGQKKVQQASLYRMFRHRGFLYLIVVTGLIHGSHGTYYSFSALHWKNSGIDESVIGYLWGLAVISEIMLMTFSRHWFSRVSVQNMLIIACLGTLFRWSVLGMTDNIAMLFLAQTFHSLSFGLTHIASMCYIGQQLPDNMRINAQALYSAIPLGGAIALFTFAGGYLYPRIDSGIFILSAASIGLALVVLIRSQQLKLFTRGM